MLDETEDVDDVATRPICRSEQTSTQSLTSTEDLGETEVAEALQSSESSISQSDSDDDCGEWITPSNVALHKSRALNLVPSVDGASSETYEAVKVACMTADFAVQNVLLQMGLDLVDVNGLRISSVKNWLLRCHACFKYISNCIL